MLTMLLILFTVLALFICFCPFPEFQHPNVYAPLREEDEWKSEPQAVESTASRASTSSFSVPTLAITRVAQESRTSSRS